MIKAIKSGDSVTFTSTHVMGDGTPLFCWISTNPSTPPPPELWALWMAEAHGYISRGYRRISRRRGIVARIDREDWHQVLSAKYPRCRFQHDAMAEDFYRRVLSQDKVQTRRYVTEMVPPSGNSLTGYVP